METQEKKKNLTRAYVCCPYCSTILLQGESVKNTVVRCENCHQRIVVEIESGKTSTIPFHNEKTEYRRKQDLN